VNAAGRIALAAIAPSATNPRKRFDQAGLDELAESIKRHDVIQPILLRPNGKPGHYELVAGERRYRAALAAGLTDIPATVRELSDSDVLEIQVIENLQRKDLAPLEEAEGYERLLKCAHPSGQRWTVEEIAGKVGKSKAYVYAKMKLLALCPEARKALDAGKLSESTALLIARVPVHDLQRKATKEITEVPSWRGGTAMSYREAADHLQRNYMLRLEQAPFDVKTVYFKPGGAKAIATACGECPKRTGNQPELFADVTSADVCTDPTCFAAKREAHQVAEREKLIAAGREVITGKKAKEILPHEYSGAEGGYAKLDERHPTDAKYRTYRQILGKDAPVSTLVEVEDHHGEMKLVEVVRKDEIKPLLKGKIAKSGSGGTARDPKREKEEIFRARLFSAIVAKLPATAGKVEMLLVATEAHRCCDSTDLLADHFAPKKDGSKHDFQSGNKAITAALPTMTAAELGRFATACMIGQNVLNSYGQPKELLEAAKQYKVDPAKVKKAIADEEKAAAAEKPEKASPKKKAAKK
jgi:ParB/RepB/Spo0J family partition protein